MLVDEFLHAGLERGHARRLFSVKSSKNEGIDQK